MTISLSKLWTLLKFRLRKEKRKYYIVLWGNKKMTNVKSTKFNKTEKRVNQNFNSHFKKKLNVIPKLKKTQLPTL